jgi:septum formation protein
MSRSSSMPRTPPLVLASTSRYRQMLLERLAIPFSTAAPNVDESAVPGELADDLVSRLARAKANAVAQRYPNSIVIGSDQLAECDRQILGKPGSAEKCAAQLRAVSGRRVAFKTAVHVVNAHTASNESHVDVTTVYFRQLSDEEIQRYVAREQPFDCAGGFKVEGLGITLFEGIESRDPTALIGLPLIWLSGALRRLGAQLP